MDLPRHGARRAEVPRRATSHGERRALRRRARQDPARDARGRDGGAQGGAVRRLLRQRRFDAALRHARRGLSRADRRSRHRARALTGCP